MESRSSYTDVTAALSCRLGQQKTFQVETGFGHGWCGHIGLFQFMWLNVHILQVLKKRQHHRSEDLIVKRAT